MEFKGIKGEWRVEGLSGHKSFNLILNETGYQVAAVTNEFITDIDEVEANAKLIASAPELLKALELISSHSNDHAMIRVANKAINKALN